MKQNIFLFVLNFFSYKFVWFMAARSCWSCWQYHAFKVSILHKKSTHQMLVISLHVKGFLTLVIQMPDCLVCIHYKSWDIFSCTFSKSAAVILVQFWYKKSDIIMCGAITARFNTRSFIISVFNRRTSVIFWCIFNWRNLVILSVVFSVQEVLSFFLLHFKARSLQIVSAVFLMKEVWQ